MRKVKIAMLGSGVVGQAVQGLILGGQLGRVSGELEIVKIYTPNPKQKSLFASHPALFTTRPEDVTDHPEAEIIVEVLGSREDKDLASFKEHIIRSFQQGKAVVTSNKAVLAKFGKEIWAAAKRYGQELRFEACVGGGVPIIRSLTESFAAEEPEAIYGIINGTCNYVLSEMGRNGRSYAEALREAQARGYAETNPKSDTSGMDAEAKLILLALVTFGLHMEPGNIWRKGIEEIQAIDFLYADRKGRSTIKHLAVAKNASGALRAFVAPVLVPGDHFLAAIDGATNAIFFKGKRSGEQAGRDWNYVFAGPGAGGGPTAVALLGDVFDLARGRPKRAPSLPRPGKGATLAVEAEDEIEASFYSRFVVKDRAGIVGDICQAFGQTGIHISEVWQLSHSEDELQALAQCYRLREKPRRILPFVITLERSKIGQLRKALQIISRKDYMLVDPVWLPIWRN